MTTYCRRIIATLLVPGMLLFVGHASSAPVPVRFSEGLVHGFLVLSAMDGTHLADGDLEQTTRGDRVTSHLVFHFTDGSLDDDTAVFSQRRQFTFVSEHRVQKGPSFPRAMDMTVDAGGGQATVQWVDEHGAHKTSTEHFDPTADLANGVILTLLKNVHPDTPPNEFSMIVATPSPKLIKLKVSVAGSDTFSTGHRGRKAVHYVLKADIGGVQGLVAPLVGKQPPDSHVWVLDGAAPAFVKSEQPFYAGGPVWRIELTSPVWPRAAAH
jgi:hypothetical protein